VHEAPGCSKASLRPRPYCQFSDLCFAFAKRQLRSCIGSTKLEFGRKVFRIKVKMGSVRSRKCVDATV
jgi:hypothetical protein